MQATAPASPPDGDLNQQGISRDLTVKTKGRPTRSLSQTIQYHDKLRCHR